MKVNDMTGHVFGRLTVVARAGSRSGQAAWLCKCDCGGETVSIGGNLRNGHVQSCGCVRSMVSSIAHSTHGLAGTPEHNSWKAMKARCLNPGEPGFFRYGGRGISICREWMTFERFLADMGPRPEGTTLDRIDVDGNYEPTNCRWATATVQANNRRPRSGNASSQ